MNPQPLEPQSSALTVELHSPHEFKDRLGAPEGIRTPDLRLRRPLLYPAELLAPIKIKRLSPERETPAPNRSTLRTHHSVVADGRGEKIRTSDPLRPRQVRYQAALRPVKKTSGHSTREMSEIKFVLRFQSGREMPQPIS